MLNLLRRALAFVLAANMVLVGGLVPADARMSFDPNGTGKLYVPSLRQTAAVATVAVQALPTLSVAPTGVYALRKHVAAYNGPAIRVLRTSDNTQQDIGFASDGTLDTAAASTFANGSSLLIATAYDQSGSGNHATQTTQASMPPLYTGLGTPVGLLAGQTLNLPATLTANRANVSMFMLGRDVSQSVLAGLFMMGTSGTVDLGLQNMSTAFGMQPSYDGSLGTLTPNDGTAVSTASLGLMGLVSSASAVTVHRDGASATSAAVSSRTLSAGGVLGQTGSNVGRADFAGFLFYPAALSNADVATLKAWAVSTYQLHATPPAVSLSMQGDSKTYGVNTPTNRTLSRQLEAALGSGYMIRNLGIGGRQISNDAANAYMVGHAGYVEGPHPIATLYEATNDLAAGLTASQIWGYYQTWVANMKAIGVKGFVVTTITPRTVGGSSGFTSAMEAQRVALNTMIRANSGNLFDAVADFAGISQLGTDGSPNLTYLPDGLHETEAAYVLEVPVLKAAVLSAVSAIDRRSTTSLTASKTSPTTGDAVTFTATVAPSAATGTVTFADGGTTLGTGTLSSGTATFATSALAAGSHTITATYGGDSNYNASTSAAVTVTVAAASAGNLMLDGLSATPSGAYSLRKIRSAYSGPAIRVTRASDSTTQDIGFTSGGDLDTASLTTFLNGSTGTVAIWYDQSTAAKNLSQATVSAQPAIQTGTNQYTANKPSVFSTISNSLAGGPAANTLPRSYSFVTGSNFARISTVLGTAPNGGIEIGLDASQHLLLRQQGGNILATSTAAESSLYYLHTHAITYDGTNYKFGIDGSSETGTTTPTTFTASSHVLGLGTAWGPGPIEEFVTFDTTLSANDNTAMQASQKAYYGTP